MARSVKITVRDFGADYFLEFPSRFCAESEVEGYLDARGFGSTHDDAVNACKDEIHRLIIQRGGGLRRKDLWKNADVATIDVEFD